MVLCCYVFVSQFHFTLPRGFSLPSSHIDLMALSLYYYNAWFLPTATHEYPVLFHLHLRSPSRVLPTLQPHSQYLQLTQSQYLQHNTVLALHRHTHHRTSFLPLPFHTNFPFPTSTGLGSQYPWYITNNSLCRQIIVSSRDAVTPRTSVTQRTSYWNVSLRLTDIHGLKVCDQVVFSVSNDKENLESKACILAVLSLRYSKAPKVNGRAYTIHEGLALLSNIHSS